MHAIVNTPSTKTKNAPHASRALVSAAQTRSRSEREKGGERPRGENDLSARRGSLVLLIDSMPLQREGLVRLLHETCSDIRVVGFDPSMEPATLIYPPTLVIINIRHDDPSEPATVRRSALPPVCAEAPILLLSERDSVNDGFIAVKAGYAGLVPATQTAFQLCSAVRVLLAGGRFFLSLNEQNETRRILSS